MDARTKERRHLICRLGAKHRPEDLERNGFGKEIEPAPPRRRRVEQIRGVVGHLGVWKAFARAANRGFGNVESGSPKTPSGKLLGVVSQAAADDQSGLSRGLLRMLNPESDEMWS